METCVVYNFNTKNDKSRWYIVFHFVDANSDDNISENIDISNKSRYEYR